MRKILVLAVSVFFLTFHNSNAQEIDSKKQAIAKAIEDYFFLERENIHVQPNKFVYLSDENIWLKGYVYHRKEKKPFFTTTNIYAVLYDENGTRVQDKLFYGSNGRFTGSFELNENFKTGKYYIQTFTNWMNNFKEDESSVTEIEIINKTDNFLIKRSSAEVKIIFFPEGGNIIEGVNNSVGIHIADCLGKPINIQDVNLLDQDNKVIQKIKISKNGFGKFLVNGDYHSKKISFKHNDVTVEQLLPITSQEKIALEINNYTFADKTLAKIKTSPKHLATLKSETIYFVIQQDNKSVILDVNFADKNELLLPIAQENFFEGINFIRIIDGNNKQLASRIIFKYPKESLSVSFFDAKRTSSDLEISGKFNAQHVSVSMSVLPENSKAGSMDYDIFNSFYFKPYLKNNILNASNYFKDISKNKQYELDLALLSQSLDKYNWYDITSNPPTSKYPFDFGLNLKGVVNQDLKNKNVKIEMVAPQILIDERTTVNEKNEFYFNNLVVSDSTWLSFSLIQDNKKLPLKVYPQITNGRKTFNKIFVPAKSDCPIIEEKIVFPLPDFVMQSITLDDIEISSVTKKRKLKYENHLGNDNLRGYKVGEDDHKFYMDVLHFIRNNGFDVPVTSLSSSVQIYSRSRTTLNGAQSYPQLFIDNVQQMNFDVLLGMKMEEIDEIYINAHAIVPSIRNHMGLIKIYRKMGGPINNKKSNIVGYEVKDGFSQIQKFKNKSYVNTVDEGFQNFGVVNWVPDLLVQEEATFKVETPTMMQEKVQVLIEGFSADGKLISEMVKINLN